MKRILALAALVLAGSALCIADEATEIYRMLYAQAEGLAQKYAAVVKIVGLGDKASAQTLAAALEDLLATAKSYTTATDKNMYARTIGIIAQALGDYKYSAAANTLWAVVESVPDVMARSDAIISIGKLRSQEYVERIAQKLSELNIQPTEDRDSGEKLAFACIVALDRIKDVRGFAPVFFAAEGWYSQRVRQQASLALPDIAQDPSDPIKEILGVEVTARKLRALQAEMSSSAPVQRKVEVAILALEIGHIKAPRDKAESKDLGDIRKLALRSLIAYKASSSQSVDGCVSSYMKGIDEEEKLLALSALGTNPSDLAATELRDIILRLNEGQSTGLNDAARNRLVKAAIESSSISKNAIVKPALIAVAANDAWSGGIIQAAQTALKAMP